MTTKTIEQKKDKYGANPIPKSAPFKMPPPLNSGDHLSRPEFEKRYHAHPEIKKAELIEGVVQMPSPTRITQHAVPHTYINTWLGVYHATTPGTQVGDNGSILLDLENELQPDVFLRLQTELGGTSHINKDDYLEGPPELIVEIAASSVAYDMHTKRRVYARNGVQEYLALQVYEQKVDWFSLEKGVYQPLPLEENAIDEKGLDNLAIIRSKIFPGLWFAPQAFWNGNLAIVLAVLQQGLASPEHTEFVTTLTTKLEEIEKELQKAEAEK